MKKFLLLVVFALSCTTSFSQTTLARFQLNNNYNFSVNNTQGTPTATNNGGAFSTSFCSSNPGYATNSNANYVEITINTTGFQTLNIYWTQQRGGNGQANHWELKGDSDNDTNFEYNVIPFGDAPNNCTLESPHALPTTFNNKSTVKLRIQYGGGGNRTIYLDDVFITGTPITSANPLLSPTTLAPFGDVCLSAAPAGPNTFVINGTNLTNANIGVGSLTGYTYSTSAAGTYTNTLSLAQPGGSYSQTIYVKFTPTAVASYNGNIPITGGGAAQKDVAASGNGVTVPSSIVNNPNPDGATDVCYAGGGVQEFISWNAVATATAYDVYFGTNTNPPLVASDVTNTFFDISTLGPMMPSTTYYWKTVPKNNCGTANGAGIWDFTTASAPCNNDYCDVNITEVRSVTRVIFADIDNSSSPSTGSASYEDYTSIVGTVVRGTASNTFTVEGFTNGNNTFNYNVYIDWNQDGDFTDTGEGYFAGTITNSTGVDGQQTSTNIPIPATALPGNTGMRVIGSLNPPPADPCGTTISEGQIEDYTLNVTCFPIDYANLQFPGSETICESESLTAYGQVYEGGLTDTNSGPAPGIVVEFGYNITDNIDPSLWPAGNWTNAIPNPTYDFNQNNDEYQYTFTPPSTGTFYYTFRYSLDGCDWQYGGHPNGFWNGSSQNSGVLTVTPELDWYLDADNDSYAVTTITQCDNPGAGYTLTVLPLTDCNDNNAAVNPAANEVCDGIDNDCDGLIDDNDPSVTGQSTWYADADGDTFGDSADTIVACDQPNGYVLDSTDCDDSNAAINPNAQDICDGIDNNCDGNIDENPDQVDYANLQFPGSETICLSEILTAYGQVYEPGVTPGNGLQGAGIAVEFGYNGSDTDPSTWTTWDVATFNPAGGGNNNDEYQYTFTPATIGTFYYTFRYALNDCDWQYGGYSGSGGGFWNGGSNVNGQLTVNEAPLITTVYSDISVSTDAGVCGAIVTYDAATTTGEPAPSVTYSHASGSVFPVGNTTVTVTATNSCGTDEKTFDVTVNDAEDPTINCAADVIVNTDPDECFATINLTEPTTSDNCSSIGNALNFDGPNDRISLGDLGSVTDYTIETWFRGNSSTNYENLFHTIDGGGNTGLRMEFSSNWSLGELYVYGDSGNYTILPHTNTEDFTQWHHVAVVGDKTNSKFKIYFDGVLKVDVTTTTFLSTFPNFVIGRGLSASLNTDRDYNGDIDEFRIWNVARSQADIQANMNNEISPQAGLLAYYKFNQGDPGGNNAGETTAFDSSGNAIVYDGTLNGFALNGATSNWVEGNGASSLSVTNDAPAVFPLGDTLVTWTVTDAAGNTATCQQTVTVEDNEAPIIACPSNLTVECDSDMSPSVTGNATATDNCDAAPTIAHSDNITAGSCLGEYIITRTWTATDVYGNSSNCDQIITVIDTTDPTFNEELPADVTEQCDAVTDAVTLTASDNCGTATVTFTETTEAGTCPGAYVLNRTWTATDQCGNTTVHVQTVTVEDTTAPALYGGADDNAECTGSDPQQNANYLAWRDNFAGITTDDNCGASAMSYTEGTWTSNDCTDTMVVTFTATDDCGLTSSQDQTFVISDTTPPSIDTAASNELVECDGAGNTTALTAWLNSNGGAVASDTCGNVTWSNDFTALSDDCGETGSATVIFTATDDCGNASTTQATFTIEDTTDPTIACPANVTINCEDDTSSTSNGTATGTDICSDVIITQSDLSTQNPDPLTSGHYNYTITRTWIATDDCGNFVECDQVITVEDVTDPTIACPADVTINCEDDTSSTSNGTATGTDICSDVIITQSDVSTQDPDPLTSGHYNYTITRTWRSTDATGNFVECDQVITVEDVTDPTIACPANVTINCEDDTSSTSNGTATGTDICSDVIITQSDVSTQDPDPLTSGHYNYTITRTWRSTDATGNFVECDQVITVEDVTDPTIACPADVTINCEDDTSSTSNGTATGTDICSDVIITQSDVSTQDPDPLTSGHYNYTITRTWRSTDATGNFVECDQVITVEDVTDPTIACPANVTINCEDDTSSTSNGTATGTDICSDVIITQSDVSTQDPDPLTSGHYNYTITRTWRSTDATGNFVECDQVITVEDVTDPTIACPADVTINCEDDTSSTSNGTATGTDICSDVIITQSDVSTQDPDPLTSGHYNYTITRTWRSTDATGNFVECDQVITVEDVTDPTIACPADVTINCEDDTSSTSNGTATGTDICSDVIITQSDVSTQDPDPLTSGHYNYTITRTWRSTDATGNFVECDQVITVEDVTDPTIACPADVTINCEDDTSSTSNGTATGTDICSDVIITQSDVSTQDPDPLTSGHYNYTITRTWRSTDATGNFVECDQVITVEDVTDPTIACPADVTINCEDDTSSTSNGTATGTDICSDVIITQSDVSTQDPDPLTSGHYNYTITRTWRSTDATGNFVECDQVITVEDVTDPTIACPANVTINCEDDTSSTSNGTATGTDICSDVIITQSDVSTQDPDPLTSGHYNYTITRTWRSTDATGNFVECDQVITVEDVTDPTIACPANVTINCEDDTSSTSNGTATGTDICSDVIITQSDVSTQDPDPLTSGHYNYTITRTWRSTDATGNFVECDQVITVEDVTDPTIACPADVTINCEDDTSSTSNGTATGTDICSDVIITQSDVSTQDPDPLTSGHYNYTITRTWRSTDATGNFVECDQVITVEDVTDPTIACPADVTINCEDDTSSTSNGTATGTDICSDVIITQSDVSTQDPDPLTSGHYNYTITRTWRSTDATGNFVECDQVITVEDVTDPTIACPANVTINCEDDTSSTSNGTATGTDICSDVIITQSDVSTQDPDPLTSGHYNYTITRTWRSTDATGNFVECDQVITVEDVTDPTIACPADVTINCEDDTSSTSNGTATGTDICSDVIITQSDVSTQDPDPLTSGHYNYTITRTWRSTDATGNFVECDQVITVEDVTDPTIACPANVTINCEDDTSSTSNGTATGTDICSDVIITQSDVSTQDPDPLTSGHYNYTITRTWRSTDATGNFVECDQVITVEDVTDPTIACPADVTINCEDDTSSTSNGTATGTDICSDVIITQSDVSTQDPDPLTSGHYNYTITRTWRSTDATGNFVECDQVITVEDVTDPTIACPANVTINCEDDTSSTSNGTATGTDICSDVIITQSDVSTQDPDPLTSGHYNYTITRTWRSTDATGNFVECDQVITVEDVTDPTIACPADVTINCEDDTSSTSNGTATGTDICSDVIITQSDVSTQDPDPLTSGHYNYTITRTWRSTDATGNFVECDQVITVEDVTDPTIACPANVTINCEDDTSSTSNGTATGTDICSDVIITQSDVSTQDPDPLTSGHYNYTITRTWRSTDATGNFVECDQVITVEDVTDPTIACPADVTINCEDDTSSTSNGTATGTDICSDVIITQSDVSTQDPDPLTSGHYNYTITRTWRSTDATGNFVECDQVITVEDVTDPTIACPADVTINCEDDTSSTSNGTATGTDICSDVIITQSDVSTQDPDPLTSGHYNYTITRTWRSTDATGNFVECDQVITVEDVTDPTIACPANVTINCEDDTSSTSNGTATGTDICSDVIITQSDVSTQDPDPLTSGHYNYTITRTWRSTDATGNFVECDQVITVEDVTDPTIACPADVTINCEDDTSSTSNGTATGTDICSDVIITQSDVSTQDPDPLTSGHYNYTITRTWRSTDATGNFVECDQVITVEDVTDPTIACPANVTINCEDDTSSTSNGTATGTDICSDVIITQSDVSTQDPDPLTSGHYNYTITRTWRSTDATGNFVECDQVITVEDVTDPTIACPADVTINCEDDTSSTSNGTATGTDICSDVIITQSDVSTQDPDPLTSGHYNYTITRTWRSTDATGNFVECDQVITVEDVTDPTIACPANVTINCEDDTSSTSNGTATGTDICSDVIITQSDVSTQDPDPLTSGHYNYTITRTWRSTDATGNFVECDQVITVEDVTDPTIACPADVTINCEDDTSSTSNGTATGTDICSDVIITQSDVSTQDPDPLTSGHYNYTITRTWRSTDATGNFVECDQVITVEDVTDPTIACPANVTINCEDDTSSTSNGTATGTDICSDVIITQSDVSTQDPDPLTSGHYNYTITRTWRSTDATGNFVECDQVITVEDVTDPTIACPADVTINCEDDTSSTSNGTATGTDICSDVIITQSDVSTQDPDPLTSGHYNYTITRTWRSTDATGNFVECDQVITVEDVTDPTIACPANVTINCEDDTSSTSNGTATGTDICSDVIITQSDVSTQDPDPLTSGHYNYTITRTWRSTDATGNFVECDQVITVEDVTDPTIACPADVTINCEDDTSSTSNGTATGTDICSDVIITQSDVSTQDPDPLTSGHYNYTITRTWRSTDATGNFVECDQVITVEDVTDPTIACPADVTINCEDDTSSTSNGTATGTDICSDVIITQSDVSTQDPDPLTSGHYNYTITRTWRSTDATGNFVECDQVITVEDVTPPVVDCVGLTLLLDEFGNGSITAEDLNNNSVDNCSPVFLSISQTNFDCTDIGGDLDDLIISEYIDGSEGLVDSNIDGSLDINKWVEIYNGTGNEVILSEGFTSFYSLNIYTDGGAIPVTINLLGSIPDGAVYKIAHTAAAGSNINLGSPDVYFDGNDAIGLAHEGVVIDYIPAASWIDDVRLIRKNNVFNGNPAGNQSEWNSDGPDIFTDLGMHDIETTGLANNVILTVTDVSGNSSTCEADVLVEDPIAPEAICQNLLVQLDANGEATITPQQIDNGSNDACGIASLVLDVTTFDCDDVGTNTVTLTVTDNNDNVSTCTATVTVEDNVPPVAICQDITVQLDANGDASITVDDIDNGSNDACGIASRTIDVSTFDCSNVGPNTVTLTVTDVNDNVSTCTATVTIEDNVPPVVVCNDITKPLPEAGANSTYTLTAADIDAIALGSTDNCGIATKTVSPDTFTCDNEGVNVVTLTVTDVNGNVSTCDATVTITGLVPVLTITEGPLPEFCQGAVVVLTVESSVPVESYLWTTNEDTQSIEVGGNGTYGVTVTSITGCVEYLEYEVTGFDATALISAYTIIAENEVFLHGSNLVESGGVGVSAANGLIKLHQASNIVGFGKATNITLNQGSTIGNPINAPAGPIIPAFQFNTYSNAGSPDATINNNQSVTLNGSVYDEIVVKKDATVTFTQPNVYINDLKTFDGASIEFTQCTNVYINEKFMLAQNGKINYAGGQNVVIYVNEDVQIEKGSYVRARLHSNGNELLAKGGNANGNNAPEPTQMIGLFICKKVHGNTNVVWNADPLCDPCPAEAPNNPPPSIENSDSTFKVKAWPNPAETVFNLKVLSTNSEAMISISVYDMSNKLVLEDTFNLNDEYKFGEKLDSGVYIVKIAQGDQMDVLRLIKNAQ